MERPCPSEQGTPAPDSPRRVHPPSSGGHAWSLPSRTPPGFPNLASLRVCAQPQAKAAQEARADIPAHLPHPAPPAGSPHPSPFCSRRLHSWAILSTLLTNGELVRWVERFSGRSCRQSPNTRFPLPPEEQGFRRGCAGSASISPDSLVPGCRTC